jgi:hypothetical protein
MDSSRSAILMPLPAAARLVEFTLPAADQPRPGVVVFASPKTQAEVLVDDHAEHVAEAFLRGRNEGLDTARAEFKSKLEEAEAAVEERLVATRSLWASEQGAGLAERIDRGFETLNNDVGDAVAAILAPFVEATLRARIVEELLRTLEKVLKGGRPTTLKISGPEDLLESIRQSLGGSSAAIEFEATNAVDVRVVADRTVIETQLEAWLQRISGRSE